MKKAAVLYKNYTPTIDAIKLALRNVVIDCFNSSKTDFSDYDVIVSAGYEGKLPPKTICVHHSLLPAFESKNPVKDAFLAGVKVTGITVFYNKPFRILAQYPIFIYNNAHYDELKQELECLEQAFLPLVVQKILNNEPFESQNIMKIGNIGGCGNCSGCGKTN